VIKKLALKKIILDDDDFTEILEVLNFARGHLRQHGNWKKASEIQSLKLRLKKQLEIADKKTILSEEEFCIAHFGPSDQETYKEYLKKMEGS